MLGQKQVKKEIGKRLKQAREKAGFTLPRDFCAKHKLTEEQYIPHENGIRAMKATDIMLYCKLLNISIQWLLLGEELENKK